VQVHGGDYATYCAAVTLVKGFDLGLDAALPLLKEWNARCSPPWEEGELRIKLDSATRSTRPSGYLLQQRARPANRQPEPVQTAAARRTLWPRFRKPDSGEFKTIAALRGVSEEAAFLLMNHQYLWCCTWKSMACFVISRGHFAQVRRMDGEPVPLGDETTVKAQNLPGSEGRFLNPGGLGNPDVPVLLTEGAVSLLESAEVVLRADAFANKLHSVALCAAVSAGSRFTAGGLSRLAGRRVRILAYADEAGVKGASAWAASLRDAGCRVDCLRMPGGFKDLGDALRAIPQGDPFWLRLVTF
jgi:hypothetical protein